MDDVLLQYGAIGVIAIVAIMAVKVMYQKLTEAFEHERDRADRLEAELRQLNQTVRNDYTTTISQASHAVTDATRAVAEALAEVRRRHDDRR